MYTYNVNTCNALIIIAFPNKSIFYSNKQNFQKFYKSCANSSKPQGSTYSYILVYNIGYHIIYLSSNNPTSWKSATRFLGGSNPTWWYHSTSAYLVRVPSWRYNLKSAEHRARDCQLFCFINNVNLIIRNFLQSLMVFSERVNIWY